jgi:hypothetical protein
MCRLPLTGGNIIETLFAPVPSVNRCYQLGRCQRWTAAIKRFRWYDGAEWWHENVPSVAMAVVPLAVAVLGGSVILDGPPLYRLARNNLTFATKSRCQRAAIVTSVGTSAAISRHWEGLLLLDLQTGYIFYFRRRRRSKSSIRLPRGRGAATAPS